MVAVVMVVWAWGKHAGWQRQPVRIAGVVVRPHVSALGVGDTCILALSVVDFMSDCLFIADRFRCRFNDVALNAHFAKAALAVTGTSWVLGLLCVFVGVLRPHGRTLAIFTASGSTSRTRRFNTFLVLLSTVHLDVLSLLPWSDRGFDGVPTKQLLLMRCVTLFQNVAQGAIQVTYITQSSCAVSGLAQAFVASSAVSALWGLFRLAVRSCDGAAPHTPGATATAATVARQAAGQRWVADYLPS